MSRTNTLGKNWFNSFYEFISSLLQCQLLLIAFGIEKLQKNVFSTTKKDGTHQNISTKKEK